MHGTIKNTRLAIAKHEIRSYPQGFRRRKPFTLGRKVARPHQKANPHRLVREQGFEANISSARLCHPFKGNMRPNTLALLEEGHVRTHGQLCLQEVGAECRNLVEKYHWPRVRQQGFDRIRATFGHHTLRSRISDTLLPPNAKELLIIATGRSRGTAILESTRRMAGIEGSWTPSQTWGGRPPDVKSG